MEWRIQAATPNEYNEWCDKEFPHLPADIQRELNWAFNNVIARTPRARPIWTDHDLANENDPVCVQFHHRTVRDVIILGYGTEIEALNRRLVLDTDNLLKLVQLHGLPGNTSTDEANLDAASKASQAGIDRIKESVALYHQRIAVLSK